MYLELEANVYNGLLEWIEEGSQPEPLQVVDDNNHEIWRCQWVEDDLLFADTFGNSTQLSSTVVLERLNLSGLPRLRARLNGMILRLDENN